MAKQPQTTKKNTFEALGQKVDDVIARAKAKVNNNEALAKAKKDKKQTAYVAGTAVVLTCIVTSVF